MSREEEVNEKFQQEVDAAFDGWFNNLASGGGKLPDGRIPANPEQFRQWMKATYAAGVSFGIAKSFRVFSGRV